MDSQFSFEIITEKNDTKTGHYLKYGVPFYLYLEKDKERCVNGKTEGIDDKFLLSYSKTEKSLVDKVNITLKLNKQQVTIKKESAVNEMVIKPSSSRNSISDY